MMKTLKLLFLLSMLTVATMLPAQIEMRTEAQVSATAGNHTPLWLNANKYGLSSLERFNGYVRAGVFRPLIADSTHRWDYSFGADLAVAANHSSVFIVHQLYGEVRWLKGLLTIGSKEQPMQLKNNRLSSGSQTLGINARPVPSIRLSLPEYWNIPFTKKWVGIKGHIAYGMQTDDGWQRKFTQGIYKHTEHTKIHTKAGYIRVGRPDKPFTVELGLEMACQYGGTSYSDPNNPVPVIKNEDGVKGALRAFIPSGGDVGEGIYENKAGNHLGSYLLRFNFDYEKWYLGIYADHFFEDHSQMFFIDYDGYGKGEEFNVWKDKRYFLYDLKDIMLGAELKLRNFRWLNNIVLEYIYTKYQSGPIYHDRTYHLSDHIGGLDNYYNHYIHTGWQHWGQVMGNPLYRSPLYNDNSQIKVYNNRFWAWHLGISGTPTDQLRYRVLATWQRGWGHFELPFTEPQNNLSLLAEAEYCFCEFSSMPGWGIKASIGLDHGQLLGNNFGGQLTITKRFNLWE